MDSFQITTVVMIVGVPMLAYFSDRQWLKLKGKDASKAWVAAAAILAIDVVLLVLLRVFLF